MTTLRRQRRPKNVSNVPNSAPQAAIHGACSEMGEVMKCMNEQIALIMSSLDRIEAKIDLLPNRPE